MKNTTHTRNKLSGIEHYNGLGMSPRPTRTHQKAVSDMTARLQLLIEIKGAQWEAISETEANSKKSNTLTPDVSIYAKGEATPIWVLEVERTKGIAKTKEKIREQLLPKYPSIREAFLYDYEKQEWHRFSAGGEEEATDISTVVWRRSLGRLLGMSLLDIVKSSKL